MVDFAVKKRPLRFRVEGLVVLNPKPQALKPEPQTLNPKPFTPNPKPLLNPKPLEFRDFGAQACREINGLLEAFEKFCAEAQTLATASGPLSKLLKGVIQGIVIGGPWDLVTTCNWAYNPTYNFRKWAYRDYANYT